MRTTIAGTLYLWCLTMALTYYTTLSLTNIYILLISRCILAAIIYYAIMKIAKVQILKECEEFVLKKISNK